jgi:hypothetical protein
VKCRYRCPTYAPRIRDIETIDSALRLVAALRWAARERGGPLPSIDVVDALLNERRELCGGVNGRASISRMMSLGPICSC